MSTKKERLIALELKALKSSQSYRRERPLTVAAYGYKVTLEERFALEHIAVELGLLSARWAEHSQTKALQKRIAAAKKGDAALKKFEDSERALQERESAALSFDKHLHDKSKAHNDYNAKKASGIDHTVSQAMQVEVVPIKHKKPVPDWVKDDRKVVEWLLSVFPTVSRENWVLYERGDKLIIENANDGERVPSKFVRDTDRSFDALRRMALWYRVIVLYFLLQWDAASIAQRITEERGGLLDPDGKPYLSEPLTAKTVENIVADIERRRVGLRTDGKPLKRNVFATN